MEKIYRVTNTNEGVFITDEELQMYYDIDAESDKDIFGEDEPRSFPKTDLQAIRDGHEIEMHWDGGPGSKPKKIRLIRDGAQLNWEVQDIKKYIQGEYLAYLNADWCSKETAEEHLKYSNEELARCLEIAKKHFN